MKMTQPTQLLLSITTLVLAALLIYGVAMETAHGATETGYLTGSQDQGLNRICFYSSASGGFAITIRSSRVCPVTYRR